MHDWQWVAEKEIRRQSSPGCSTAVASIPRGIRSRCQGDIIVNPVMSPMEDQHTRVETHHWTSKLHRLRQELGQSTYIFVAPATMFNQ